MAKKEKAKKAKLKKRKVYQVTYSLINSSHQLVVMSTSKKKASLFAPGNAKEVTVRKISTRVDLVLSKTDITIKTNENTIKADSGFPDSGNTD